MIQAPATVAARAQREIRSPHSLPHCSAPFFFASGIPALVYRMAWQRILALHSGVGIYSVALIVAAFMGGLGIGHFAGGMISTRPSARGALRTFGPCHMAGPHSFARGFDLSGTGHFRRAIRLRRVCAPGGACPREDVVAESGSFSRDEFHSPD